MNENGLNTIGLNIDVVLGMFWTKTTTRWVMAMELMVDLYLDFIYGFGRVPWTSYGYDRTLLKASLDRIDLYLFLELALPFTRLP